MNTSPEAMYDCLLICHDLVPITGGAAASEIASFSYLSCLLAVYTGMPPSEWGYSFAATKTAAPYSDDLKDSVESLRLSGLLDEGANGFSLTPRGEEHLVGLSRLSRFSERRRYVTAACRSATAIPLPLVTESLNAEPQLRQALKLSSLRSLLDETGRHAVLEHFAALAEAVPSAEDLLVPAVVWLTYLSRQMDADNAPPNGGLISTEADDVG